MVFNLVSDDLRGNMEFFGEIVQFFAVYHPVRDPLPQTVRRRKELRCERTVALLPLCVASRYQGVAAG